MRRTLLPLAILLAAAIAAPAPAFAGGHGASAEGGEKGGKKEGDKKEKDDKKGGHKLTQSESYVGMDPLYTSIMEGPRPLGLLMIGIGLDVPDAQLREKVEHDMPRLRDAYVRALMSFTATNVRSWRQPDVVAVADRLQRVTDRVLAKKGAKILLGQVAIQLNN